MFVEFRANSREDLEAWLKTEGMHCHFLVPTARRANCGPVAPMRWRTASGLCLGAPSLTRNPPDAEDVRHDAILRVMTRLEQSVANPTETRVALPPWEPRIAAHSSTGAIR